jgi:hypothetical protein
MDRARCRAGDGDGTLPGQAFNHRVAVTDLQGHTLQRKIAIPIHSVI